MFRKMAIFLVIVTVLAGCATGPKPLQIQQRVKVPSPLPDILGEQGLLVATIAADAVSLTNFQKYSFSQANVQIDNTYYSNAVHDNYLVLPLRPGEYMFDSLHIYKGSDDRATTRYPMDYKFRIVRGQATSLGAITLVPKKNPDKTYSDQSYYRLLVNNTNEMTAYLRKNHPKLAATLSPPTPVLASELKFADANLLEALRRDIARRKWLFSDEPNVVNYVGGQDGTIARLLRDSRQKVAAIDVLDTGTTVAMLSCSGHDERFVCSSVEPALYFVHGDKTEKRPLPIAAKHVWVHTYPPKGLVLIDQNLTIHSSSDNGASWRRYVWYPVKTPLPALANIRFANGKNGYYVYSTFSIDPLAPEVLYTEYGRDNFRKVEIPNMKTWQTLVETSQGLLVGPQNTENSSDTSRLYFRPTTQTSWQVRALPGKRCFYLQHDDNAGLNLAIFCDGKFYRSTNEGSTWEIRDPEKK